MFLSRVKRIFALTLALFISALAFTFLRGAYACKLCAISGERTFYLYTPSSQAVFKRLPSVLELNQIQGESVSFAIEEGKWRGDTDAFAWEIGGYFGASFVFSETACGVTSYYFYADGLYTGVQTQAGLVNLQVAVSGECCAVGSPMIFGGF